MKIKKVYYCLFLNREVWYIKDWYIMLFNLKCKNVIFLKGLIEIVKSYVWLTYHGLVSFVSNMLIPLFFIFFPSWSCSIVKMLSDDLHFVSLWLLSSL